MELVTVHAARTRLCQLLARVEAGEEIILARGSEPVARLVPFYAPTTNRRFGALRGHINVGPAFFEQLPEDELVAWE